MKNMTPRLNFSHKILRIFCIGMAIVSTCVARFALATNTPHPNEGFENMLPQNVPPLGANFKDTSEFLKAIALPKLTHANLSTQVVTGDLDRDGNADTAVLLQSYPNGCEQLFILLQKSNGPLNFTNSSKAECGVNLSSKIFIRNGSLFVYSEALIGAYGTMQFRFNKSKLELIGAKLSLSEGVSESALRSVNTDINFQTGYAIFKRIQDDRIHNAHVAGKICFFKDFDFDLFYCVQQWHTSTGDALVDLMSPLQSIY
jgi:hypothetical protein